MTQICSPLLYLNMGGEMMYVLQKRLHTQKINPDKINQVLIDVIFALLHPRKLLTMFDRSTPLLSLGALRDNLERVVLSSMMRLDENSMNKLFDLMIMMVKYQLTTATGPREVLLLTLNHLDAIRVMTSDRRLREHVDLAHRLVVDTFGSMSYKEVWQIRNECLIQLQSHRNVRVSVLLRLGMQNEDTSFNRLLQRYDEKYLERRQLLDSVKIIDYEDDEDLVGSLSLFGRRGTFLGTNVYSSNFGHTVNSQSNQNLLQKQLQQQIQPVICSKSMKNELDTLAAHLGKDESTPTRPFTLHLFANDNEKSVECSPDESKLKSGSPTRDEEGNVLEDDGKINESANEYKNNLIKDVNSQFDDVSPKCEVADLMKMLDVV